MYEQHFNLRERAFHLTLDPRYFLWMPAHREALANVEYAVTTKQGITLLIGEAGTGKTMVLQRALANAAHTVGDTTMVYLGNPALSREDFFECLADQFGLGREARGSKTGLLRELVRHLREQRARDRGYVLVIDEAQSISDDMLEEIRLLRNLALDTELLPLILAGQPELAARLAEPHLVQLKQRIALRCFLEPLRVQETATFIGERIRLAGGEPGSLFTREAVFAVHEFSRGIPRTISVICENALLAAFAAGARRVNQSNVVEVARELDYAVRRDHPPAENSAVGARVHTFRAPVASTTGAPARNGDRGGPSHGGGLVPLRRAVAERGGPAARASKVTP